MEWKFAKIEEGFFKTFAYLLVLYSLYEITTNFIRFKFIDYDFLSLLILNPDGSNLVSILFLIGVPLYASIVIHKGFGKALLFLIPLFTLYLIIEYLTLSSEEFGYTTFGLFFLIIFFLVVGGVSFLARLFYKIDSSLLRMALLSIPIIILLSILSYNIYSVGTTDINDCLLINDRPGSNLRCFEYIANKYDVSVCELAPDQEGNPDSDRKYCYESFAKIKRNASICDLRGDEYINNCYDRVAMAERL